MNIEFAGGATVTDTEKNQAWFSLLIDGKVQWYHGPMIVQQAGTERRISVPEGAHKIRLVFSLKGLGIAELRVLQLAGDKSKKEVVPSKPASSVPVNLDFSDGLNGWQTTVLAPEFGVYKAGLNSTAGTRFTELQYGSGYFQTATFSQTLDAVPFHRQVMILDADCRATRNARARIFIMSSTHAANDVEGKRDALQRSQRCYSCERVGSENWKHYRIVTEVDDSAKKLEFGLELYGKGKVAIRNVRVRPLNPAEYGNEGAQRLSDDQTRNLRLFANAYGCIRYFDSKIDLSPNLWNAYLLWAVRNVLSSKEEKPEEILNSVLKPIDPELEVVRTSSQILYRSPRHNFVFWKHTGYGADRSIFNPLCRSAIIDAHNVGEPSTKTANAKGGPVIIGDGLACVWTALEQRSPLTTLPEVFRQRLASKPEGWSPSGNDRITRLSCVIALWNAAKYFYPYNEALEKTEWSDVLHSALQKAAVDPGESAFLDTLERMTPVLKDDQCRIYNNRIDGLGLVSTRYSANLCWEFFNDKLIVTGDSNPLHPLRPVGRRIVSVSGSPIEQMVRQEQERVSASTPERIMHRIAQNLLLGSFHSELVWGIENSGYDHARRDIPIASLVTSEGIMSTEVTEKRPLSFSLLEPGTIYVDLTRIRPSDLKRHMTAICNAPRVVFDCRGTLSRGNEIVFQHLFSESPPVPKIMLPVVTGPEAGDRDFANLEFNLKCISPKLKGRTAFLVDTRSAGRMELYLMMVEATRQGRLVGARTAGTAGSVTLAQLPADYLLSWTATKTLKPDGSRFNGVGVVPTDDVMPSLEGIKALKDEVLDKALSSLKKQN